MLYMLDTSTITSITGADNELTATLADLQTLREARAELAAEFWDEFDKLINDPAITVMGPGHRLSHLTNRTTWAERNYTDELSVLSVKYRQDDMVTSRIVSGIFHVATDDPQRYLLDVDIKTNPAFADLFDIAKEYVLSERQESSQTEALELVGKRYGELLASNPSQIHGLYVKVGSSRRNRIGMASREGRRAASGLFSVQADPLGQQIRYNGVETAKSTDWVGEYIATPYERQGDSDRTTWDLNKDEHVVQVLLPRAASAAQMARSATVLAAIADGRKRVTVLTEVWEKWKTDTAGLVEKKSNIETCENRIRRQFGSLDKGSYAYRNGDPSARLWAKLVDRDETLARELLDGIVTESVTEKYGVLTEAESALLDAAPAEVTRAQATETIWPALTALYFGSLDDPSAWTSR